MFVSAKIIQNLSKSMHKLSQPLKKFQKKNKGLQKKALKSKNNMFPVVTVYIISMFTHSFRETGASLSSKAEPTYNYSEKLLYPCNYCVLCDIDCDIFK